MKIMSINVIFLLNIFLLYVQNQNSYVTPINDFIWL